MVSLAQVTVKKNPPNYEKGKKSFILSCILFKFDNNLVYKRKKKIMKSRKISVYYLFTAYAYYGSSQKKYFWEMVSVATLEMGHYPKYIP